MVRPITPIKDRFWQKVAIGMRGDCWPWTGHRNDAGYGIIATRDPPFRQRFRAHRIAYELHHGVSVPPDVLVLHSCDNPPCCNPRHLFLGSQRDNIADMHAKNRQSGGSQPGEANKNATLTDEDVRQIRRMRQEIGNGYGSIQRIADTLNLPYSAVWAIVKRRSWKHVP